MSCFYVCLIPRRLYSAEIELMSDIVVRVVDAEVSGLKHRFGWLEPAAGAIADAMEGHQPKEFHSPMQFGFPQPGEWWGHTSGRRFYCAGFHGNANEYVVLYSDAQQYAVVRFSGSLVDNGWKHLPGCDSFSWEEPKFPPTPSVQEIFAKRVEQVFEERYRIDDEESVAAAERPLPWKADEIAAYEQKMVEDAESVLKKLEANVAAGDSFPQYYTVLSGEGAYVKRTGPETYVLVRKDGEESPVRRWTTDAIYRRLLTEAEAMAKLDPSVDVAAERIPAATVENTSPSNQQLFEAVANLRDQMDRMNKKSYEQQHIEACVSLRVPSSGNLRTDHLIRAAVRRDIAVAFVSGSLAFSPIGIGRSDWQESNQLADLPKAAVAFADDMLKQLGFEE